MTRDRSMIEFGQGVIPILKHWRDDGWDLRDIFNAGVILWHEATPAQREAAMGKANRPPGQQPCQEPPGELRSIVRELVREYIKEAMGEIGKNAVGRARSRLRRPGHKAKGSAERGARGRGKPAP